MKQSVNVSAKQNPFLKSAGFKFDPAKLRRVFRNTNVDELSRSMVLRRRITALAAMGAFNSIIVSLFQAGMIKKLPDVPFENFDAMKVSSSAKAYTLGAPDAFYGLLLNALIALAAQFGGTEQAGRPHWASKVLAVLTGAGA